ncbi:MAG TPA: urate hydroxylase PuuD [Xanthobacteraceae bacterium]|nr:urate hydroxylase PuuD [Xanthobacteraceae bacterium]
MVELVLTEWVSAILRWLHVVAGIAWIGSSFYFIHLDLSLKPRPGLPAGVKGDEWQVHGGGFYHMMKYLVAPAQMPDSLTWFKWEAYTTWLSGFSLLVVVYYLGADIFLIDKSVLALTAGQAAGIAFGSLVISWLVYEGLCRSPLGRHEVALALVGYVYLVALTYGFTHVFSGLGAFTQIGALIGTIMVANVFVIIIPYQKKTVDAMLAGTEPDPYWGQLGKQRSVHNNYLTLPVVFLMLSNHYPLMFATRYNWVIVAIVLLIGPVIRHFFNSRHEGKGSPWWTWGVAAAGMAAIAWLSAAGPRVITTGALPPPPKFKQVSNIVLSRCSMCHAAEPVWDGIPTAPKGVLLDSDEQILLHARLIDIFAVRSQAMPPGNITEMTPKERLTLASWFAAGTPAQ